MRAAMTVDYAARPLPLFYAISQAGRAISAALGENPWQLTGHGLKHHVKQPLFRSIVTPQPGMADSFSRVCYATESAPLTGPVELGSAWASLPELFSVDLPEEAWRRPLRVTLDEIPPALLVLRRNIIDATIQGLPNRVFEDLDGDQARGALRDELAKYPRSEGWQFPPGPGGPRLMRNDEYGWDADVQWPVASPGERDLVIELHAPAYRSREDRWLRPVLNEHADSLSPLMAWWALLYGLSMLARYHPAPWVQALDVDNSRWAVPLEYALDEALEAVPRLVLKVLHE